MGSSGEGEMQGAKEGSEAPPLHPHAQLGSRARASPSEQQVEHLSAESDSPPSEAAFAQRPAAVVTGFSGYSVFIPILSQTSRMNKLSPILCLSKTHKASDSDLQDLVLLPSRIVERNSNLE